MWRGFISPLVAATLCTIVVFASLHVSLAQVMQSSNYKIQSDSVNFGGGFSSSTNYVLESTAGEVGTGVRDSTSYSLRAGYQQMHEVYIAISSNADITLSPNLFGVTGGTANASTTFTVTTDSPSGYALTIAASSNPAMQKGADNIDDYSPVGNPDFTFTTTATSSHFGYSPEGVDIVTRFKDNGVACNVGALDTTSACWDGLSTTEETIASDTSSNHPAGATTTIRFRVGIGNSVIQPEGVYVATTTLTALPL